MKSGTVFWGTFFVALGVFLLLDSAGILSLEWSHVWRFWPAVLIILGVMMLVGGRFWKAVGAVVAALLLALILSAFLRFAREPEGPYVGAGPAEQTFTEEMTSPVSHARFSLEAGAGTYVIADTTSMLFEGEARSSVGTYTVRRESDSDEERLSVSLAGRSHGVNLARYENRFDAKLNAGPAWDIEVNAGASRVDLDLRKLNVRNLALATGAASVKVSLGDRSEETDVNVETGVSTVRLEVPAAAGCEVRIKAPLSTKHFPGFTKLDKGHYVTENFERAAKRIRIQIEAGVSTIKVTRASDAAGEWE